MTRDRPHGCAGVPLAALRDADGHQQVQTGFPLLEAGQRRGERITVFDARLRDLAGESLGDFGGLGDATPFCDQTGNVGARGEEASASESLDAKSNRCFGHRVAEVASFRRNGFPQVGDGTVLLLSTILLRMHLAAARCRVGVAGTGRSNAGPGLARRGCRGLHRRPTQPERRLRALGNARVVAGDGR